MINKISSANLRIAYSCFLIKPKSGPMGYVAIDHGPPCKMLLHKTIWKIYMQNEVRFGQQIPERKERLLNLHPCGRLIILQY